MPSLFSLCRERIVEREVTQMTWYDIELTSASWLSASISHPSNPWVSWPWEARLSILFKHYKNLHWVLCSPPLCLSYHLSPLQDEKQLHPLNSSLHPTVSYCFAIGFGIRGICGNLLCHYWLCHLEWILIGLSVLHTRIWEKLSHSYNFLGTLFWSQH